MTKEAKTEKRKYEVIRPWYGAKRGDIVEFETVPHALKANVRLVGGDGGNQSNQAAETLAAAQAEAKKIVADAKAEVAKIRKEAEEAKGELTPATPAKK